MKFSPKSALLVLLSIVPLSAFAHKAWLLPSATVLTPDQWITVDAAISNDLFYFNHAPLKLDNLLITAPDGTAVTTENPGSGKFRSTFDLHLALNGTYRLAIVNAGLFANYEMNGEKKRWRGTAEALAKEIPTDAKNLEVNQTQSRVETFVTAGAPNLTALKGSGAGLELMPVTHPNDLFSGEVAKFRFTLDGKPAAGLKVTIVPGGSRYRNKQDEIELSADKDGEIAVNWPRPGTYWLEATVSDANTSVRQAKQRRANYAATFEVLPQ
ncbi:MAG: DUF4198 domain-containing protein [Tahibacter sp.]